MLRTMMTQGPSMDLSSVVTAVYVLDHSSAGGWQ